MQIVRLGETTAALIEIPFTTVLASNLQSRILGSTLANGSITVKIKQAGVTTAVSGGAGTFTAVDDTNAPGVRGYRPASSELATGVQTFIFTGTNMEPREIPVMVIPDDPYHSAKFGTAVTGTLNATSFSTSLTEATNDYWKDALLRFTSGNLAGQVKKIGAYNGTTKVITLATVAGVQLTFTGAPANGDTFELITR